MISMGINHLKGAQYATASSSAEIINFPSANAFPIESAAAGDDNRHGDITRTVRELSAAEVWRAEFYRMHAGPKASKKQAIDAVSLVDPDISDAEYRVLRFRLYYCNEACDNYFGSNELEAALLPKSVSAIERASQCLEGPDNYQTSKRRRNQSSLRSFDVPDCKRQAVQELMALLETADLRVGGYSETAKMRIDKGSETADLRVETPETANLQLRNRKNAHLTLKDNSKEKDISSAASRTRENAGSKKKAPLHPLPVDWRPSDKAIAFAANGKVSATPEQIENQIERFCNNALAKGLTYLDWDAAFRTWMLNARQWGTLVAPPAAKASAQPARRPR